MNKEERNKWEKDSEKRTNDSKRRSERDDDFREDRTGKKRIFRERKNTKKIKLR